jgi:hypothetical protein
VAAETGPKRTLEKALARVERHGIFDLVLKGECFFGQVGGLPDVRSFLKEYAEELRQMLKQRWEELLTPSSPQPLVANILINPNLLFCHRDAMRGQYSRYFRPVYLDTNAVRIDEGKDSDDDTAKAIVELHRTFDRHYDEDLESRPFLSLNDIEALLHTKGLSTALPAGDKVISIWRISDDSFELLSDSSDYWPQVNDALRQIGTPDVEKKFKRYLTEITNHSGSYHHVSIGSRANWVGRIYLAFRHGEAETHSPEWITGVKSFAFDVVAPLALAGTFIRNPGVIAMLGDVRDLLLHSHETRRRHSSTFDRFFGSPSQANRKIFPNIDYVRTARLSVVRDDASNSLRETRNHFRAPEWRCWCKEHPDEPLTHALEHCNVPASAGSSFLADVNDMLKGIRAFEKLPDDTVRYLADALVFGLSEDEERPRLLSTHFEARRIPKDWIEVCRQDSRLEDLDLPKSLRPFVRALLLMIGNRPMLDTDASRFGVCLDRSIPVLKELKREDRNFVVKVEYRASGDLKQTATKELDSRDRDALHANNNALLLHFGKQFLDDFRMCITTSVNMKVLRSSYRWLDLLEASEGTIIYAFGFSY